MNRIGWWCLALVGGTASVAVAGAAKNDAGGAAAVALLVGSLVIVTAPPGAALMALFTAVAPDVTTRALLYLPVKRRSAFWLGMLYFGISAVVGISAISIGGPLSLVGGLLLLGLIVAALVGYSGIAVHVGRCILPAPTVSAPAAAAVGALVLGLAASIPVLGQVIGFYVLCLSLGLFPFAWFGGPLQPAVVEPSP